MHPSCESHTHAVKFLSSQEPAIKRASPSIETREKFEAPETFPKKGIEVCPPTICEIAEGGRKILGRADRQTF